MKQKRKRTEQRGLSWGCVLLIVLVLFVLLIGVVVVMFASSGTNNATAGSTMKLSKESPESMVARVDLRQTDDSAAPLNQKPEAVSRNPGEFFGIFLIRQRKFAQLFR